MTAGQYHLNPVSGNAGACKAEKGQCPFGGTNEHFSTPEEAMANYEALMAGMTLLEPTAREVRWTNAMANLEQDVITDHDTSVSVVNPDDFTDTSLIEAPLKELGDRIVAGEYDAYYSDPKSDESRQARITIDEQGRVMAVRVPDPASDAARTLSQEALVAAAEAAEDLNNEALNDGYGEEDEHGSYHRKFEAANDAVLLAEEELIVVQDAHEVSLQNAQGQKAVGKAESNLIAARADLNELENEFHSRVTDLRDGLNDLSATLHGLTRFASEAGNDEAVGYLNAYDSEIIGWSQKPLQSPRETNDAIRRLQDMQEELEHLANQTAARGEDASFYEQASGAFEPKLSGTADLVTPE